MGAEGCYLVEGDINWHDFDGDKQAVIDKVEQIIDKVTKTHWCATAFDIKLNGNNKNRLFIPIHTDIIDVTSIKINCVELDPNWWEHDINSVFLDPCIGDSMWGMNAIKDGDFYYWKTSAPTTNLYYWIETIHGTSTINRDADEVQVGNYCVRMDIDGDNEMAQIKQRISLLRNRNYRLAFKYMNSVVGKTAKFMLHNEDLDLSLLGDGTWSDVVGKIYVSLPNEEAWTDYSLDFTSHADFVGYELYLENDEAASSSIYFDNAGILTAGIAVIAADISEGIFPRGFNNIEVEGTMGEGEAADVPEAIKQAGIILTEWEADPSSVPAAGLMKSEKIGDYSYTKLDTSEEDLLTGVDKADMLLRHYIKRKAIIMAP